MSSNHRSITIKSYESMKHHKKINFDSVVLKTSKATKFFAWGENEASNVKITNRSNGKLYSH